MRPKKSVIDSPLENRTTFKKKFDFFFKRWRYSRHLNDAVFGDRRQQRHLLTEKISAKPKWHGGETAPPDQRSATRTLVKTVNVLLEGWNYAIIGENIFKTLASSENIRLKLSACLAAIQLDASFVQLCTGAHSLLNDNTWRDLVSKTTSLATHTLAQGHTCMIGPRVTKKLLLWM